MNTTNIFLLLFFIIYFEVKKMKSKKKSKSKSKTKDRHTNEFLSKDAIKEMNERKKKINA